MNENTEERKEPVLHSIKLVQEAIEKEANLHLKEKDLTLAQGHVLRILMKENGEIPLKELEKRLNLAQSTTAGIVLRLEKKEFVETYIDEHDKRVKIVRIKEAGKERMKSARIVMKEVEERMFTDFTDEERESFIIMLEKAAANFE